MFAQRAGYRASGEAVATHSRRRYRLLPGAPQHGLPNPDPSLWLTHYSKAQTRDHVPAANIPIMPHIHALIQQRRLIQSQGQLPRKEFMLHDRSNWPVIHLPGGVARAAAQGQLPPGAGHRRGGSIAQEATVEEEEDVSRGDLLDFMTPRDVSRLRYEQHHEWMEEIIESPYPTSSIIPSDLGFGKKGQLEELTKDFFDAPIAAMREPVHTPARVGKMASGQADEFIQRASSKLAAMQAELEQMRKRHSRRMDKMRRSTSLTVAEKKLRTLPNVPERRSIATDGSNAGKDAVPGDAVEEVMSSVQSDIGQKLTKSATVTLVWKGGLEERKYISPVPVEPPTPTTSQPQQPLKSPVATIATAQQAQPLPQISTSAVEDQVPDETEKAALVTAQPQSQPDLEADEEPSVSSIDQSDFKEEVPQTDEKEEAEDVPAVDDIDADIDMDGMDDGMDDPADDADQGGEEWVMIGEGGPPNEGDMPEMPTEGDEQVGGDATEGQASVQGDGIPPRLQVQMDPDEQLNTPDFDMGGDFDNVEVDTAGDALASYGDDEDLNLDSMEGSAFGDAFHPEDEEIS